MKFDQTPKGGSGESTKFIRLKDGQSVKGVLRGDIHTFYQKWEAGKTIPCSEDDEKASFRFRVNMVVSENGSFSPKILEMGSTVYKALKDLSESGWDLEKQAIEIKRKGSGLSDTEYTTMVLPNGRVSPEMEQQLSGVQLHNLTRG